MNGGAITDVLGAVRSYFWSFVKQFPTNFEDANWASQTAVFFLGVSILILFMKFWWDVMSENEKRKGDDKIHGLIASMRFLGMRMFLVPMIVFASAIPQVTNKITPSAFAATGSVANRVAAIGDDLVDSLKSIYSMYVNEKLKVALDPATMNAPGLTDQDKANLKRIQDSYWQSDGIYKATKARVDELMRQKALYAANPAGSDGALAWDANKAKELQDAQSRLPKAEAAFNQASQAVSNAVNNLLPQISSAQDKQTLDALKAKLKGLKATIIQDAEMGFTYEVANPDYVETQKQIERLEKKMATGSDSDPDEGKFSKLMSAIGGIYDFLIHIGFYACICPAFLGLIAGAILCLKEALGLLQFGAKLDIIKNLTFSVASAFGPLFMLGFLFDKTEQYGWKYITLMFSIFFSFFAISYTCAITLGPAFNQLRPIFSSLTAIPLTQYDQKASMELFVGSVKIGLKGLGVGMITAFLLDVVKSAIAVGQNVFGGHFSAGH